MCYIIQHIISHETFGVTIKNDIENVVFKVIY
jgi:hypothetical protein